MSDSETAPLASAIDPPSQGSAEAAVAAPVAAPIAGIEAIERAAALLREGGLVAFATETVYGLGADAGNRDALQKLYRVKKRPAAHPVIVHLAGADDLPLWAAEVSPHAEKLVSAFWPGPLTLVVRRATHVLDEVTGGQDTVALRVPSHPLAQALLVAMRLAMREGGAGGRPSGIAAPSANRFGKLSPTRAEHVRADLGADVDLILDGGECEVGIESTIVDLSGERPAILRPGRITAAQIEKIIDTQLVASSESSPVAPGSLALHYAPRAKAKLAKRVQIIDQLAANRGRRIAVLAIEVSVPRLAASLTTVESALPASYAHSLYANLRRLDATGADLILIETPPDTPGWAGVMDRLRRATRRE
ncbi:MAG: threonylcarbamoyl-AMP synthase [Betaproteobacteria bacterium]|nr:threonylcarbamoyl-AMP synthase [Betaproteobacteria bacterium]